MKVSKKKQYVLVAIPDDAGLWASEAVKFVREALRTSDYQPTRHVPVKPFNKARVTVRAIKVS